MLLFRLMRVATYRATYCKTRRNYIEACNQSVNVIIVSLLQHRAHNQSTDHLTNIKCYGATLKFNLKAKRATESDVATISAIDLSDCNSVKRVSSVTRQTTNYL